MAKGRPQRPYHTSWGEVIVGLYHCPDGRWRINATGKKFTEHDERRAVQKFRDWEASQDDNNSVLLPVGQGSADQLRPLIRRAAANRLDIHIPRDSAEPMTVRKGADPASLWAWMREQLITQPEVAARMTGIPELANLRHMPLPRPSIKLTDLIQAYRNENPSTDKSKREAIAVFDRLVQHAGAKTLDDLTQESLQSFRRKVEESGKLKSAGTRRGYYGRIKSIIGFGLKVGMDQTQIRAALDRCRVLWTGEAMPHVDPTPISREAFHVLLDAGDSSWRPWLLLSLNLCMTAEDLCELKWKDFDLGKGTYAAIRVKTRRDRIPRAGVLWLETIAALKDVPKRSEYVFTSTHGTRYNKNSRVNLFAELRAKAGLPDSLKWSDIRDAAYTTACQATTDERWARVLAGHRAAGLQDNYVLRNPEAVRLACEAVYKAFGPFPIVTTTSPETKDPAPAPVAA